ncbi:MAG TPA: vanadium-dependent haloperoxidase, partial [Polyangiaceae bacterium]|nr:vanadium-dependent haloperoxidase [Polyangiaceae bacterium]
IADGAAKDQGIAAGQAAAADILALRTGDGSDVPGSYSGSTDIGLWRPTPTALAAASTPEWATLPPFALTTPEQFRPGAPPALGSAAYAVSYTEVKLLGKKTGSARTTEQTRIANFWAVQTHIPFNAIARSLAKKNALAIDESARLFALLNLALADSRIAAWDAKYFYGSWRPITAIQNIDPEPDGAGGAAGAPSGPGEYNDGNADTVADPAWEPLLATPNHPDYVSGHSTTGAAAAAVLAYVFGDATTFTVGSETSVPEGLTREYSSFTDAAEENAVSRVYGGIHFSYANEAGLALGTDVGNYVVDNFLQEIPGGGGEGGAGGAGGAGGEAGAAGSAEGGTGAVDGEGGAGDTPGSAGEPATEGGSGGSSGSAGKGGTAGKGGSGGASAGSGGKGGSSSVSSDSSDDSGCSVSAPANGSGSSLFPLAGLAAALLLRRRRGNSDISGRN